MTFYSVLYESSEGRKESNTPPACFSDLNLDQIIDAITAGRQDYNLKPFFHTHLRDVDAVLYRHEVMRDLENQALLSAIKTFAQKMVIMRRYQAMIEKLTFKYHLEGWSLEAADVYSQAVAELALALEQANLSSRALTDFREYVMHYAASLDFQTLFDEIRQLKTALATVKYCVIINGLTVRVRRYEGEIDYSVDVLETFEKFKQGAPKDYRSKLHYEGSGMSHVEAQILDYVARLYPDVFASLDRFYSQHGLFINETIRVFDREVQFYVAYLEYMEKFRQAGLQFCYPGVSIEDKEVNDYEGFDLALAANCLADDRPIVCNDFSLGGVERIFVVSGPNQGGKTTFARMFGQLHYLASLGLPVPGKSARLFLPDVILTHFEREENIKTLRGKLQDDLVRIHEILNQATPNSIIIMNEIFTSTTLKDGIFLSRKVMERIMDLDLLCIFVTFLDELASLSGKTVSAVSTVVPENPTQRTFKIVRKPADGLAYALSIAEKYRLTYERLKERIKA